MINWNTVIVGVIALIGTIASARISASVAVKVTNALVIYRLEQLEKKVDKHNNIVERTYILERDCALLKKGQDDTDKEVEEIKDNLR